MQQPVLGATLRQQVLEVRDFGGFWGSKMLGSAWFLVGNCEMKPVLGSSKRIDEWEADEGSRDFFLSMQQALVTIVVNWMCFS